MDTVEGGGRGAGRTASDSGRAEGCVAGPSGAPAKHARVLVCWSKSGSGATEGHGRMGGRGGRERAPGQRGRGGVGDTVNLNGEVGQWGKG